MFGCSCVHSHSANLGNSEGPGEWFKPEGACFTLLEFCNEATAGFGFSQEEGGGGGFGVTPCVLCKHRLCIFPSVRSGDSKLGL